MNESVKSWYTKNEQRVVDFSKDIWNHPELLHAEYHSCEATADFLRQEGFRVSVCHCKNPSDKPNTVVAEYGEGYPVIAIFGEYDALPGLGQEAVPYRKQIVGAGHGCGHNLMIAASVSAACAVKAYMQESNVKGTLRFLATPAEEGGNGKMYMHKLGLFDNIDCLIGWHPETGPLTGNEKVGLSISKIDFSFKGKASHAAAAPELGRSSMDAAELMSVGIQYLREHMSSDSRIHHCYKETMKKANVVPDYSSVQYVVRARDMNELYSLMDRVVNVAEGAALMTGTKMEYKVLSALSGQLIVTSFTKFLYESALKVPPLSYTEEEKEFASRIYSEVFDGKKTDEPLYTQLVEPDGVIKQNMGSNDLGYITYTIPTARYVGLGLVKDTPVHHWALTATAGMSIGQKAAVYVGKCEAQSLCDILDNPSLINTWKTEMLERRKGQNYEPVWPE